MQLAEGERAHQQMSLMPGSEYQPMTSQPYDIRNFLPMNLMDPNDSYTCSDQTPLQLVYDALSLSLTLLLFFLLSPVHTHEILFSAAETQRDLSWMETNPGEG